MPSDRIAVLWRNADAASGLRDLIARVRPFHRLWNIDISCLPALEQFLVQLETEEPDALFVEIQGFTDIANVLDPIRSRCLPNSLVVFGHSIEDQAFIELHRTGLHHFLHLPAKPSQLESIFHAMKRPVRTHEASVAAAGKIVSFLPAKPGAGASTAAMHFAHACAGILQQQVALVDLDLNCGVQAIFPCSDATVSLVELIKRVNRTGSLPESSYMTRDGAVEIFHSTGRSRNARLDSAEVDEFLSCLQQRYPLVVVDHSGNWERYSVLTMQRSAAVLFVCGSDQLSVTLAQSGLELVREDSIANLRLLFTRCRSKGAMDPSEAQAHLDFPLFGCLPNAYIELQKAIRSRTRAPANSVYGAAISDLSTRALAWLAITPPTSGSFEFAGAQRVLAAFGLRR